MRVVIMRHGEAELFAETDEQRNLTSYGRQQAQDMAHWLADHLAVGALSYDLVLVSPYVRAQQTAEMVLNTIAAKEVITCNDITPNADIELAHDYLDALLATRPAVKNVLIVSHMPFVSYFVSALCKISLTPLFATSASALIDYNLQASQGHLVQLFQGAEVA